MEYNMDIINNYLNSIKNMSEKDKEHTHRSALENLLNEIKEHTGNNSKAGMFAKLKSSMNRITTKREEALPIFDLK